MRRIGLTVPAADEPLGVVPQLIDDAAAAGYTDAWTSELTASDAFAPLTVAALRAPQLRLGTSIASVFTRSPALLAMSTAGLADLSPQPVYCGIGASSHAIVQQWHGIPFRKPYTRVRDTLRFLKLAFDGGRIAFQSESFDIDGFRLAAAPARRPRILVAALRERMLRLAGAEADGVILNWLSPSDVSKVIPYVLDGNPDADVVARLFVIAAEDRAAAREIARRTITAYLNTPVYAAYHRWLGRGSALEPMWQAWQAGDRRGALAAVPDGLVDELFITGDVATIRAGIADYVAAGITIPVLSVMGADAVAARKLAMRLAS